MAPSASKMDHDRNLLRIVIDHGTGEEKISAQWIPAGASQRNPPPFTIRLMGQGSVVQKAVLEGDLGDGRLIWGERDVNLWSRHHPRQTGKVCQLWKLVLHKRYRNTPTGRAVFKAIGAEHGNMETFEEFLTMQFRQVREMIIDRLVSHHSHLAGLEPGAEAREYWANTVQVETLLMVPAGWSQDAQSIMVAAATDAGFNNVGPVYESLVAVASEVHCAEENRHVAEGHVIVTTDIGRGTVDISSGMLEPHTRVLKLVGNHSTCGMAGGQQINDFGAAWVETCPDVLKHGKDVHEVCRRMGITIEAFRYRVSDEFERVKPDFPNKMDFQLTIRAPAGWDKINNGLAKVDIDVPWYIAVSLDMVWESDQMQREKMKEFFDHQLNKVTKLLDSHLLQHAGQKIHGAISTAGGAKNAYVRQELDEYFLKNRGFRCFDPQDRHPTCHAALQHYPENHPQQLPAGVLYICRGEEWDKNIHTDVIQGSGLIRRNFVKTDGVKKRTRIDWVDDRLTTIMSKRDGEQPTGRRVVMIFNVLASKPGRITFPLFHSTNARKEHQPAYRKDGEPRAGLTKWTVRFANMTGDLDKDKHNFPAVAINGRDHYVVTTIVAIEGDDTHLDLVLQVIKADDLQYDEIGQARVDIDYQPLTEKRIEVWDRFRSYFPIKDEACPEYKVSPFSKATERNSPMAKLEPEPSPSPMPIRRQAEQNHQSASANPTSRSPSQQRADSGVSVSAMSQESSLFVSDVESSRARDAQPSAQGKLLRPRKRKRTSHPTVTRAQRDTWAVDTDEDELSLERPEKCHAVTPKGPASKAKRPVGRSTKTKVQAQGASLFSRFARKSVGEDDEDEDDEETIAVTPRKTAFPSTLPVSPSTSPSSPQPQQSGPALPRQSSADLMANVDEVTSFISVADMSRFVDDTESGHWPGGGGWSRRRG